MSGLKLDSKLKELDMFKRIADFLPPLGLMLIALAPSESTADPTNLASVNCQPTLTTRCDTVTNQRYGGGGGGHTVVPFQACLSTPMWRSIVLLNGTAGWEAGFYYGNGEPEIVKTERTQCWQLSDHGQQQHGAPGAYVVAFICCDEYCGWVAGQIPAAGGQIILQRIAFPAQHEPGETAQFRLANGQYDRSRILN